MSFFKPWTDQAASFRNSANGSPVLYLDFDGVLHPHEVYATKRGIELRSPGHHLFEGVPMLEAALAPYPNVKIVLSTSWVIVKGFALAKKQLPQTLADRVIGATFHRGLMDRYEFQRSPRGEQIASDATRRGATNWLALDDDDEGWPPYLDDRLIRCDSNLGILCEQTRGVLNAYLAEIGQQHTASRPDRSRSALCTVL